MSVSITGWSSSSEIAKQLPAALVDTDSFDIKGYNYTSTSTKSAGVAAFLQYGTWEHSNAGRAPGHFIAPFFPSGAVMLLAANILGTNWPGQIQLVPGSSLREITRSIRSANLNVTAKSDGYLKVRWAWQDSAADISSVEEGHDFSSQSSFRILINGALFVAGVWVCTSSLQCP
jgi:hypothetical protein